MSILRRRPHGLALLCLLLVAACRPATQEGAAEPDSVGTPPAPEGVAVDPNAQPPVDPPAVPGVTKLV